MSEFFPAEIIPQTCIDEAVNLADGFLPIPEQKRVPDGYLYTEQNYLWHEGGTEYLVGHARSETGADLLVVTSNEPTYTSDGQPAFLYRVRRLHATMGSFDVTRIIASKPALAAALEEQEAALATPEGFKKLTELDRLEMGLGLKLPDPQDWPEFMDILRRGEAHARTQSAR